jgi:hypothetical protein
VQNDPVNFLDPTGLDPEDPPPTTHIDPVTGEEVAVPGINAGVVTIQGENSGLGMFGGDANLTLAVIDHGNLNGGSPGGLGAGLSNAAEHERIRNDVEKAIAAKACADFLKSLLDETAVLTGQPYRDIMVTFDNIHFSYGDTGAYGGTAKGSFENGTASAIIRPFERNFISADRSAFIRTQTAQNFLGETLHHVGTNSSYTDGALANALNAILVTQGKDVRKTFSDRTEAEVQRASMYWHQKQFEICQMRYEQ